MSEYPDNSFSGKATAVSEKERRTSVVKGGTSKNQRRSFLGEFFTRDARDVKEYIIFDVLLPKIKDTLFDLIDGGASMVIYGDGRRSSKKKGNGIIKYNSMYDNKSKTESYSRRSDSAYDEIIFDDFADAEEVLNGMLDILEEYNMVTVSDYYELAGEKTTSTDGEWGWTNLASAKTERVRDGYIIKLPRAKAL